MLHRDRLYIVNDNDEQSFLAAYDARTGAEVWRVNRAEGTNWATPFVWENPVRTEIVTSGSDVVRSYDLSGKLLWELKGMSTISVPTPFASHGMLMLSSGYIADPLRPAYAIRPGASGDISLKGDETSNAHIVWALKTGAPYQPTPIVVGDTYYTVMDRGFFTAHDVRTGKEIYPRQRISTDAGGLRRVALVVRREDLRHQRGWRHLRHSGRTGVQGAGQEFARRDDARVAGGGARQRVDPDALEPVPHHERGRPVTTGFTAALYGVHRRGRR